IVFLREGPKSSKEIFNYLISLRENFKDCKRDCKKKIIKILKKPTLYYHLRELESVGIISLAEFKLSKQNRAPEKIWKLNVDKLVIKLR
ncbi:MAG TPA: hypothetical protein VGB37_05450, partial [Candidatus Lokiarchaeia archaeon]